MLLIILGAGASYDSYVSCPPPKDKHAPRDATHSRLPLADQLFEDRPLFNSMHQRFDACQPLVPELRQLNGRPLEQVLERIHSESLGYGEAKRQLAAVRYYIQSVIAESENMWEGVHLGATNQKALFNLVESWRAQFNTSVCIVTFNYDTLVEKALGFRRLRFLCFGDYLGRDYQVIKLHGSVDWVRPVSLKIENIAGISPIETAKQVIDHFDDVNLNDAPYEIRRGFPPAYVDVKPRVPAIAIPVQRKSTFECPLDHVKSLRELLPKVRKLLIVGWRARENHFKEELRKMQGVVPGLIVGGNDHDTQETANELQSAGLKGPYERYSKGFSNFVNERELIRKFLLTEHC